MVLKKSKIKIPYIRLNFQIVRQSDEAVWEEEYSGETRTLDSHIQRLRKKLDWNDRIVTVFRIGYRLEVHQ